jgi:ABC-2 type transport system permease protein
MEDEDIEITAEELAADPTMLLLSNDALVTGAKVTGLSVNEYQQFINNEIVSLEQETEVAVKEEKTPNEEGTEATAQPATQPTVMVSEDNADILMQLVIESSAKALAELTMPLLAIVMICCSVKSVASIAASSATGSLIKAILSAT